MESSGAFSAQKPRTFMFYIVCDVSRSMWDTTYANKPTLPYQVIADALPELIEALDDNEQVRDIGRLSIIAFSDDARVIVPLTQLRAVKSIPALPQGVETDYRAVFTLLNKVIRADADAMKGTHAPYRPVVYFITDGEPQKSGRWQTADDWHPERKRLGEETFDLRPSVVALGLGDVDEKTLRQVASTSPPGAACVAEPGQPVGDLLRAMLDGIVVSITYSSGTGELEFETPAGMRRLQ